MPSGACNGAQLAVGVEHVVRAILESISFQLLAAWELKMLGARLGSS